MTLEEIFLRAVEKETRPERDAYLDGACGQNVELRAQVEALIAAHDEANSFLEQPLLQSEPTLDRTSVSETTGTTIGHYKLLQEIGEGGFGVVFMAEQQEPVVRRVALKIIKPGMDSKEVVARFEAERQALAMMDHPNIARVYDGGTTETGRPYFVMELVRGIPITDYCDRNDLTPEARLELFATVCRAVQHAHQKGIIHRDIKPNNVLVTLHDGQPVAKVIDFGVAKAIHQRLTDKTLFTNFLHMIGTPLYMSPEQAELSGLDIDTRTDIYSLGVLLYELLTGTTPFDRERLRQAAYDEMRRIIREEEPLRPSSRLSTLGETLTDVCAHRKTEPRRLTRLMQGDLDWIVMKSLEKDRNRRYENANDLAQDIGRYLGHEPVLAGPPSLVYRARKFARRNRGLVSTITAISAALLLGLGMTVWGLARERQARAEAVRAQLAAETERQRAEQEAEKSSEAAANAELALQVIGNALGTNNGGNLSGSDQTVGAMLDSLVKQLDTKAVKNSFVEANIRYMLGRAYWKAGRQVESLNQFKSAWKLMRVIYGDKHDKVHDCMMWLSLAEKTVGDPKKGEQYAKTLISILESMGQEGSDREIVGARRRLGEALLAQQRNTEAREVLSEALAAMQANPDYWKAGVAWCMANLSDAEGRLGNRKRQLELLNQASAKFGQLRDWTPQWQMETSAGNLYQDMGDYAAALAAFKKTLRLSEQLGPQRNANLRVSLRDSGYLHWCVHDFATAVIDLQKSIELARQDGNTSDREYVFALGYLSLVQRDAGNKENARESSAEAARVYELAIQSRHPIVGDFMDRFLLAQSLAFGGRPDPSRARQAQQWFDQACDLNPDPDRWLQSWRDIIQSNIAECRGDWPAAIKFARLAWERECAAEGSGNHGPELQLVYCLRNANQLAEIEPVLRKGLEKRLAEMDEDVLEIAYARFRLAGALRDLERAEEVKPLATAAWQRMGDEDIVPVSVKAKLLDVLAWACEATGQSEEAAAWKQKAAALAAPVPAETP